jgi:hypothetical protein
MPRVENDEGEILVYQKEDKGRICMLPNQGKTILENQELTRFSKTKMRWMTAYVA